MFSALFSQSTSGLAERDLGPLSQKRVASTVTISDPGLPISEILRVLVQLPESGMRMKRPHQQLVRSCTFESFLTLE